MNAGLLKVGPLQELGLRALPHPFSTRGSFSKILCGGSGAQSGAGRRDEGREKRSWRSGGLLRGLELILRG
jgi:hypothetical protein